MSEYRRKPSKSTSSSRNVDGESRKPRVSHRKPAFVREPSLAERSDSDSDSEVDEIVSDLKLQELDDTARPPIPKRQRERARASRQSARPSDSQKAPVVASARQVDRPDQPDFNDDGEPKSNEMAIASLHFPIHSIRLPGYSTFVPNSAFMFLILHEMHTYVSENSYLYRTSPGYNTILSRIYYSVLFFVQVLRAKASAGNITMSESRFLRQFERQFAFESLPVAGPLVLYFRNLASVKTDDPMYNWITPTLPAALGPVTAGNTLTSHNDASRALLPWVPGLFGLFEAIKTSTNLAQSVNVNSEFIPFPLQNGGNLSGVTFPASTHDQPLPNGFTDILSYPGMNIAPEQTPETLSSYHAFYRRMKDIPTIGASTPLENISQFLRLDGDMTWFSQLRSMMTDEATFFKGSIRLSDIESTTGLSTLVLGKMKELSSTDRAPAEWYVTEVKNYSSYYSTTRGATSEMDFRIGMTNSIILAFPTNHPRFSNAGGHGASHLTGDYFANTLKQHETPTDCNPASQFGQVVQLKFYDSKPANR